MLESENSFRRPNYADIAAADSAIRLLAQPPGAGAPQHADLRSYLAMYLVDIGTERFDLMCRIRSARVVGMLVDDGDDENWSINSREEQAKRVLSVALKAVGDARKVADAVIDTLGRRGFKVFGELLIQ